MKKYLDLPVLGALKWFRYRLQKIHLKIPLPDVTTKSALPDVREGHLVFGVPRTPREIQRINIQNNQDFTHPFRIWGLGSVGYPDSLVKKIFFTRNHTFLQNKTCFIVSILKKSHHTQTKNIPSHAMYGLFTYTWLILDGFLWVLM